MEVENGLKMTICVYRYRWVILSLAAVSGAISFIQFLQYSIISNITQKYYDVSDLYVQISGLMFPIVFILLCLPTNYFIERFDLRISMIASIGLTALGAVLKIPAVHPERFYLVLIAQFLCALGQIVILSIPSKLASTWFGPKEVSTACAIIVFGTQIGISIGCVWPANAVRNDDTIKDKIGDDFWLMMIINGAITVFSFILVVFFFKNRPEMPPSQSQVNLLDSNNKPKLLKSLKEITTNRSFWCVVLSFGLSVGIWTSNAFLINDIYLNFYPGSESDVGIISAIAVFAGGCVGSVFFGYFLDKYHAYRNISFIVNVMSAVCAALVGISLYSGSKLSTFFVIPLFGFFMGPTLLIAFEYATEVTYPMQESVSLSVLNSMINIIVIVSTLVMNVIIENQGYIANSIFQVVVLVISALSVFLISSDLHRHLANNVQQ